MSEFLAEASVLIRPNTAGFRQTLIAELTAATRGLKVQIPVLAGATSGVKAVSAAQRELATTTTIATRSTQRQIAVQTDAAAVARAEAKAQRDAAKAAAEHAAAQSQLRRGAGATGLSLLGARGATLAAGSEFLIGAAAVTLLAKAVQGASEDEETLFGVSKVLGDELGNRLAANAQKLGNSFGIADDQALKFEGALAATLNNAGIAAERNAELSESLVKVAADLGAVRHVPVEDTLKGIQLAVSGNTRSLRQYGIVIQNTEVQQRALTQTGKKSVDELTRQELTLARISLIFDRASFAAGGFARNSDSLANKSKILSANIDRLGDSIGRLAIGPVSTLATVASRLAENLDKLASAGDKNADATGKQSVFARALNFVLDESSREYGLLASGVVRANKGLEFLNELMGFGKEKTDALASSLFSLLDPIKQVDSAFQALALNQTRFDVFTAGTEAALEHLTQLDIVGGTSAQRIATLRRAIGQQQEIVDNPASVQKRRDARQKIADLTNQIRSIEEKDRSDAEAARSKAESEASKARAAAEKAAREAQQRLDDEDHRLLFEQQIAQTRLDIRRERVQQTKSLQDDIALDQRQLALLDQQIVDARQIHDKETRLQTIQQLRQSRVQAAAQLREDQAEQRQAIRERRVTAAENAVESARLDFELAQTLNKPSAQIAALQAENAALTKQAALWRGNTLKQKGIRNQIAANNAEIRRIRGEVGNRTNELARLQFQFLETQAGFAANLLGNLIPRSAAVGTVGGAGVPAISTSTGPGPAGFATAAHRRPFNDLSAASQTSATAGGASRGQMATLIQINQGMLSALLRIAGRQARPHPEIAYQAQTSGIDFNVATGT